MIFFKDFQNYYNLREVLMSLCDSGLLVVMESSQDSIVSSYSVSLCPKYAELAFSLTTVYSAALIKEREL